MPKERIFIGGDHAAFALKGRIVRYLLAKKFVVKDFGPHKLNPADDYPDFIAPVAKTVAKTKGSRGIALGGTGIGECMVANKFRGVRAALVFDAATARLSREHNDANVLCLGGRTVTKNWNLTKKILDIWLGTPASKAARHRRRLAKIMRLEKRV